MVSKFTKDGEKIFMQDEIFMKKAIELSKLAVEHGNEPFGAVLVKDDPGYIHQ